MRTFRAYVESTEAEIFNIKLEKDGEMIEKETITVSDLRNIHPLRKLFNSWCFVNNYFNELVDSWKEKYQVSSQDSFSIK